MNMTSFRFVGFLLAVGILLAGCDLFNAKKEGVNSAVVTSVSPVGLARSAARTLDAPHTEYRYIDSGAPEYLKVKLTSIAVLQGTTQTVVWTGPKTLTLQGSGTVDLGSGITLTDLPAGRIDTIRLNFERVGQIKGTLVGDYEDPSNSNSSVKRTFYTKAAYVWDTSSQVNVGETTTTPFSVFETGPEEEADVYLSGSPSDTGGFSVDTASSFSVDPTENTRLTILVDLSRMLRFEDGRKTGGTANAHFFCHSVFGNSVAAFFGKVGSIHGYSTMYSTLDYVDTSVVPNAHNTTNVKEILGWMTVAFDGDGDFLSGMSIGDDDDTLTISKGQITGWTANATAGFDFGLSLGQSGGGTSTVANITGFVPATSLGSASPDVDFSSAHGSNETVTGKARFTLQFKTP